MIRCGRGGQRAGMRSAVTNGHRAAHRWHVFPHGHDQAVHVEFPPADRKPLDMTEEEIDESPLETLARHSREHRPPAQHYMWRPDQYSSGQCVAGDAVSSLMLLRRRAGVAVAPAQ